MTLPTTLALSALALAGAVTAWLLWRSRDRWPALPAWSWNDIRKTAALFGTMVGAAVLTAMAWGLLNDLVFMAKGLIGDLLRHTGPNPPPKEIGGALATIISSITWGLKLMLGGVIVVLLSLGLVITPRYFDFHGPGGLGGRFGGGEDPLTPEQAGKRVADAAAHEAEDIASEQPTKTQADAGLPDALK